MAPEAVKKSPVGIVADLPAQKKKPSEIRAEKNEATREEGNALFKAGNVTAAAAKYTECIDSDPQDALSLANRAECYLRARQFHLALRDADAARAADPAKPKALYKRAMALNGLGRYPEAVKTLKELLAVEPEDAAAKNALAECVRNSVVGVPTGATDPQVSRRCRARLRVRPRRPEEWQARVARVRLTSQILDFHFCT